MRRASDDSTTTATENSATDLGRRHIRGSALLMAGRVIGLLLGMATQVLLVRTLTKVEFGAFAYALALAMAARTLLSLGQGRLLSRFMAKYDEEQDVARMFGAMLLAVLTILSTSVVGIGLVYLALADLIGSALGSDQAVTLVLILIFLSPLEALDSVFVALFAVFTKPRAIFFRKYLMTPGLRLVVVVVLVLTDASAVLVAVGYVVSGVLGLLLYTVLLVQALRERGLLEQLREQGVVIPYRAVFEFSFPLITGEVAMLSLTVGGVFVLGYVHSATEVADYRAVFSAARLNTAVNASFATLFLPMIAKLKARDDLPGLRETYWQSAAFVAVLTFPVFALTGPLAPATTVALFGERYADSADVLSLLAVGYFVSVSLGFNTYAVQVCGRIRYLVVVNLAIAVANVALCFALAPRWGAEGVAVASCLCVVTQNLLNQLALRRELRSGFIPRSCWRCYGAIVAVTAALWLLRWGLDPGLLVSVLSAAVGSVVVLVAGRSATSLASTFPELGRVPVMGRLVR